MSRSPPLETEQAVVAGALGAVPFEQQPRREKAERHAIAGPTARAPLLTKTLAGCAVEGIARAEST